MCSEKETRRKTLSTPFSGKRLFKASYFSAKLILYLQSITIDQTEPQPFDATRDAISTRE